MAEAGVSQVSFDNWEAYVDNVGAIYHIPLGQIPTGQQMHRLQTVWKEPWTVSVLSLDNS